VSIRAYIADEATEDPVAVKAQLGARDPNERPSIQKSLMTDSALRMYGQFTGASVVAAGTTNLVRPVVGGAVALSDLVISGDRTNAASILVQLTDGANTIPVVGFNLTDGPIAIHIPFNGRWHGWLDARLELVVVGNPVVTVSVGYVKLDTGLSYTEWDARR
jgi:hypothetical protein